MQAGCADRRNWLCSLQAQPNSWQALPGTQALLTRSDTVNADNPVAMRLVAGGELGGLVNTGYWGIPVQAGQAYSLRLFLKFAEPPEKVLPPVHSYLGVVCSVWASKGWARAESGAQAVTEYSTRIRSRLGWKAVKQQAYHEHAAASRVMPQRLHCMLS